MRATMALLNFCAKASSENDDTPDEAKASFNAGLLDDFVEREIRRRA